MRLVFCGTPQFAIPTFRQLLRAGYSVEMVVTQPDRPSGRGASLPGPVKAAAAELTLPVVQPEKIKNNPEFRERMEAVRPDAIVVVAYGRIIPQWMLELPRLGILNLHASLLPKYRGAAPIQWAIANGEPATGVTTMRIDEGLDTGDILLQREMVIAPDQTTEDLLPLLAESGAELMVETLGGLETGSIRPRPQDDSAASNAPILKREDGLIDFRRPAGEIYNRWRGFQPWPGAYTWFRGKRITIHRLSPAEGLHAGGFSLLPGEIVVDRERMYAAAGDGTWIQFMDLQVEGRKRLPAPEFLRGMNLQPRERLG